MSEVKSYRKKIIDAFWSPTRQQFLPLVLEDVVNRSGVAKGRAVPVLQSLVRCGKIKYETLPGGRHCYTIERIMRRVPDHAESARGFSLM